MSDLPFTKLSDSSFTKFTVLVNDLDEKEGVIRRNVNEVNNIDGKNESDRLNLVSYHYQYLLFFFFCLITILFMFRMMTSDTTNIDNIILIIVIITILHHFFYNKLKVYILSL